MEGAIGIDKCTSYTDFRVQAAFKISQHISVDSFRAPDSHRDREIRGKSYVFLLLISQ